MAGAQLNGATRTARRGDDAGEKGGAAPNTAPAGYIGI
jgi:hypothetical protein